MWCWAPCRHPRDRRPVPFHHMAESYTYPAPAYRRFGCSRRLFQQEPVCPILPEQHCFWPEVPDRKRISQQIAPDGLSLAQQVLAARFQCDHTVPCPHALRWLVTLSDQRIRAFLQSTSDNTISSQTFDLLDECRIGRRQSSVYGQYGTSDKRRFVGSKKEDCIGNILRATQPPNRV